MISNGTLLVLAPIKYLIVELANDWIMYYIPSINTVF